MSELIRKRISTLIREKSIFYLLCRKALNIKKRINEFINELFKEW